MTENAPLVFVQTTDQLATLPAQFLDIEAGVRVIGLAPHLSLGRAASQAQLEFFPYTDFLTAAEFVRVAEEAQELSRSWLADCFEGPEAAQALEAIRLEVLQGLSEILLAQRIVSRALGALGPGLVILPAGLDAKVGAVVRYEAEQQGIVVRSLDGPVHRTSGLPAAKEAVLPVPDPHTAEGAREIRRAVCSAPCGVWQSPQRIGDGPLPLRWPTSLRPQDRPPAGAPRRGKLTLLLRQVLHNAQTLARHAFRQVRNPRPVVLSFGAGVDSVNQQRLLAAIEAAGAARPACPGGLSRADLTAPFCGVLVRAGVVDRTAFNRPGHSEYPVFHFVPWHSMLLTRRYLPRCRQGLERFRQRQKVYEGPAPMVFANPWLDPFTERIALHLLPHAMATQRDARALLRRFKPRLVLTSNEVSFPVRTLVLEAKRQHIPTLGLIHSGLNNMLYRDFRSDRMAVWGAVHVHDFVRVLDKAPAQLVAIGNPLYDTYACLEQAPEPPGARCPRVLVITAISQWQMFYFDLRQHESAWRELERLPEAGIQVMIKPHPRFDDYPFYRELEHHLSDWRQGQPGIALVQDAYLEEVLPACDLVVVPTFPTTGSVEAMLCRKPVLYLMCGTVEIPFCTSIAPGCLVVRDVEQIRPRILEVLQSPELQAELIRKGQGYLDQFLGPRDGQATHRLAELIAKIGGSAARRSGMPEGRWQAPKRSGEG